MALAPVTVAEIKANIVAALESKLNQTIPLLDKAYNRVLPGAIAAVFIQLYKYAGWSFLQMFIATAQNKESTILGYKINPLVAWGNLLLPSGEGDPTPATQAEMTIQITVTTQTGTLPSGTQLVNSDNQVTYITLGGVTLDAATKTVNVRAASDQAGGDGSGTIGNLLVNASMDFVNPQANVAQTALVTTIVTTGADAEETEVYRRRIIDAAQARPQGGAYSDYRTWGQAVEGVLGVYPYTGDPGEVDVYVSSSTESDRIPTDAQLAAVCAAIELDDDGLASRRPVGSMVNVYAVTIRTFDVTVTDLSLSDDEATLRANITTALEDYFLNREMFISGLDVPPRRDRIQVAEVQGTVADLVSGDGAVFTEALVYESSSPVILASLGEGELAVLGAVTFA
jgi:uncharacterized phage protein gp47/JayE